jgi:hypothetical protein
VKIAHPKTNIRRTFLEKLCFDFIVDSLTIELGFSQQVAAEALKIFRNEQNASLYDTPFARPESPQGDLNGWEGRKNRYMKCEAIDARTLVRTQATHLRLDPQFNLPRLVIPIGIHIYDVPSRKSSLRDVSDLRFHD